jgi:serum/glucocorticoid-regulated kinase 2
LAERSVLAQINNPFIVPLKFSFQSPEKLYLVLAFVNGGELFHHLQREQRFDINRSRFYAAELLCALECLHGFNVIYRDLKPENILLDYSGHIALCDFGLCKLDMKDEDRTNSKESIFVIMYRLANKAQLFAVRQNTLLQSFYSVRATRRL